MLYGLPPPEPEIVTIRVLMLRTSKATLDGGATTQTFEEGQEYDLPDWLAEAFFRGREADPAEAYLQPPSEPHPALDGAQDGAAPVQRTRKRKSPQAAQNGAGSDA